MWLLYADDAECISFTPTAKLMDYIHLAQQMAECKKQKQGDGISPWGG
jgi:hypothetical protein